MTPALLLVAGLALLALVGLVFWCCFRVAAASAEIDRVLDGIAVAKTSGRGRGGAPTGPNHTTH